MERLQNLKYKSLKNGSAKNIEDFFEQIVKEQFKNEETITEIHKALMKYIDHDNSTFFLRLYGSFRKDKYEYQRRGFLTQYPNGIRAVFCDNTFSMHFTSFKLHGVSYNENDLHKLFSQKKLCCGFSQVSQEKELAYYTPKGAYNSSLNSKGWYLAHIKPVGYSFLNNPIASYFENPNRNEWDVTNKIRKYDKNLTEEQLKVLKAHFIRLIHPLNSFLVPKPNQSQYNGKRIGEETELLIHVQEFIKKKFPVEYQEFEKVALTHNFEKVQSKIGLIEWFENLNTKQKNSPPKTPVKDNTKTNDDSFESMLDKGLKSIGKVVFLEILFPEIQNNKNIRVDDLVDKYPVYKSFTQNSQKSRLSSAKSIFEKGMEYEALQIIIDSKNLNKEVRIKASHLINKQ